MRRALTHESLVSPQTSRPLLKSLPSEQNPLSLLVANTISAFPSLSTSATMGFSVRVRLGLFSLK